MKRRPNTVLRRLRVAAGLTQAEVARRFGWTQGFVSQLEQGQRPVHRHVLVLAGLFASEMQRLDYTIEDLLRGRRAPSGGRGNGSSGEARAAPAR